MLIGIATLISILLLGGNMNDVFYVNDIDKLVTEYVLDKPRKKEILADFKIVGKNIDGFHKLRKEELSSFKEQTEDISVSSEKLNLVLDSMKLELDLFNSNLVKDRIRILDKITEEEWNLMVEESNNRLQKEREKEKGKEEEPFKKTRKHIAKSFEKEEVRKTLNSFVDEFIASVKNIDKEAKSINTIDSKILSNKESNEEELTSVLIKVSDLRRELFSKLLHFRTQVIEICEPKDAEKVMATFNSELEL